MERTLTLAAVAAALMAAPMALPSAALAQDRMQGEERVLPRISPQTPGAAPGEPGAGVGRGAIVGPQSAPRERGDVLVDIDRVPAFEERMGPGQTRLELVQTTLLNRFSALGFNAVREFRREDERYFAEALTPGGEWVPVEIDPNMGTISIVR